MKYLATTLVMAIRILENAPDRIFAISMEWLDRVAQYRS